MSIETKETKTNKAIAMKDNKVCYYLSDKEDGETHINTKDSLIPYFDLKKLKSIRINISGATGSGKTYLCEKILETTFKKSPQIYLFSSIWDKDYQKIKNLMHLDIHEFYEQNPKADDIFQLLMPDSVCIFDDILAFEDKRAKAYLKLRSQCLATGRHRNISTICIEQQPRNFMKSRDVLLNSEVYIFFPKSSYMPFKKTAEEYLGLTKAKIEEIGQKSRFVAINKVYPSYAIREHDINIL